MGLQETSKPDRPGREVIRMDNRVITADDLKKGDKAFRMGFWMTEGGSVIGKANSKKEAEAKLADYLDAYSIDDKLDAIFECTHREWDVLESDTKRL
jgi:hypothetical protein